MMRSSVELGPPARAKTPFSCGLDTSRRFEAADPAEIAGKPATSSYRTEIPVAAPEADFAADSDAEDGAEETINGDFGPQKGIANMAAFDAEIMRDFLVDVDKIFYDFASHRAEDVPDTSIRTVADAYFVRYLGMMRERQTALHKLLARTPPLVYGLNELDG
ncbi:hypothetical protein JL722_5480 [Aureococcus anophagefferens]|nr:hypothetical protein JL722_5480 [Aureococcus anophagefferens]